MTEMALLDMARQIPQSRQQELYDFARFLVEQYANTSQKERIAAFESENEMIDFINDVGKQVYYTRSDYHNRKRGECFTSSNQS